MIYLYTLIKSRSIGSRKRGLWYWLGYFKNKSVIDWDGKVVFPLQTVESELYIKE